jgi:Protein of unknown function (DUF3489)
VYVEPSCHALAGTAFQNFRRRKVVDFWGEESVTARCRERGRFWLLQDPALLAIALMRGFGGDGAKCRYDQEDPPMSHRKSPSKIKIARAKDVGKRSAKPERISSASTGSGTKQQAVLALLREPQGTTIAAIMKATGWQPHSVRGFLTAVVRKKLGLTLLSAKPGEERVYRIVAKDVAPKRKGRPGRTAA